MKEGSETGYWYKRKREGMDEEERKGVGIEERGKEWIRKKEGMVYNVEERERGKEWMRKRGVWYKRKREEMDEERRGG
jgi:hypothetical protein